MSLSCHEEIAGVLDVTDENAARIHARMSATSRACRVRGIWRTTRHTDKRAALHRGRPPADQSGKLNTEVARHADILARILARKLLSCNLSGYYLTIRSIQDVTLLTTGLRPRSRSRSHHYSSSSSSSKGKARASAGYSNSGAANTHGDSDAGQLTAS